MRLGARLRELRERAGISGVEFARRAGWSASTVVSQVEKGRRTITVDHVRLWGRICEAPDRLVTELLAEQANVAGMWLSLREQGRGLGLNARQKLTIGDLFSRVQVARTYQTKVIPGLLQTPEYMTGVLRGVRNDRRIGRMTSLRPWLSGSAASATYAGPEPDGCSFWRRRSCTSAHTGLRCIAASSCTCWK